MSDDDKSVNGPSASHPKALRMSVRVEYTDGTWVTWDSDSEPGDNFIVGVACSEQLPEQYLFDPTNIAVPLPPVWTFTVNELRNAKIEFSPPYTKVQLTSPSDVENTTEKMGDE